MSKPLVFDPKKWHACQDHDWQKCALNANCYSYVLNRPDYFWAVPGMGFVKAEAKKYVEGFNNYFKDVSLTEYRNEIIQGAVRDGLVQTHELIDRDGFYLVALFFAHNAHDFHWYRKDDDGSWSHKDGWHMASNQDNDGNLLKEPPKETLSPYSIFGGFFLVPCEGVELKQNFDL
jgi:hypothetical protein